MKRSTDLIDVWIEGSLRSWPKHLEDERAVILADYISSDVQASIRYARELLTHLEHIASGAEPPYEGTGNAFTVLINPADVEINNEIFPDDPHFHFSHSEFREALEAVIDVVESYKAK